MTKNITILSEQKTNSSIDGENIIKTNRQVQILFTPHGNKDRDRLKILVMIRL